MPGLSFMLAMAAALAAAQTNTFPPQAVGTSSAAVLVPVTIPPASTVTGFEVFGDGIQNSEFTQTNGGTCQTGYFPNGTSCTMPIVFSPKFAGIRKGAIVATGSTLIGQNPTPLDATSYMSGTGQAPQGLFSSPFSYSLEAGDGPFVAPQASVYNAFAVDGAGNLYIGESNPYGPDGNQVDKLSGGNLALIGPSGSTSYGDSYYPNANISCVAVDPGGTVYFTDDTNHRVTEIQPDGSWYEAVYARVLNYDYTVGCGLDAQGNLYIGWFNNGFIRINLQSMTPSFVKTQQVPTWNLTADAAGNVYYFSSSVAGGTNAITEYSAAGQETTFSLSTLWEVGDLRADAAGNLFIVGDPAATRLGPNPWGIYEIMAGTTSPLVPVVTGLPTGGFLQIAPNGDIYYLATNSSTITRYARNEASLTFPAEPVGSTSDQTDVTLTNNGNLPLDISGIVADAGILWMGSDTTCTDSSELAPNATCTLGVEFQPTVNGPFVGNVYVTDNDPNFGNQQQIVVQGSTPTETQTITFPQLSTPVKVGDTATLAATSDSGLPITYKVSGPATLSGVTLTYTAAGTVTVTAMQPGDSTYQAALPISQTITVQAVQVATSTAVTASGNATFGSSVTLTATVTPASGNTTPTGAVTFQAGNSTLGSSNLNSSGVATLTTSSLPVGTDGVVASYAGDTNDQPSTSDPVSIVIATATPVVTVKANPASSTYGASVSFSATVAGVGSAAAPTGTLSFTDGSALLGTATLKSGTASVTASSLAAGTHTITAAYAGDANYAAAQASGLTYTVAKAAAKIALTGASASLTYGTPLPVQVSVTNAGGAQPSGAVTFYDGANSAGTATLQNGVASFTFTSLGGGAHSLTAFYAGDANDSSVTSVAQSVTVNPESTTLALAVSSATVAGGGPLTLTATVSHTAGSAAPTGTVTFYDGKTVLGTASPNASGAATFTTSSLTAGSHTLTAAYSGDVDYAASSANNVSVSVSALATTTALTSSAASVTLGTSIAFTATVVHASGSAAPTGSVTFFDGTSQIGNISLGASGTAVLTTSTLAIGSHSITAQYSGDAAYAASTSTAAAVTITAVPPAATTTTLTAGSSSIVFGSNLTLTVNVAAASGTPDGTVTILDGATTLGMVTLSNGAGAFSTATLAVGTHNLTASYAGNSAFAASVSSSLNIVVTGTPTFTVAANPNSLTIASGSSASTVLTFTPVNGYTGSIQLGCGTALPPYVSCTFSPANINFTAASQDPQNVTLTISTQAVATAQAVPQSRSRIAGSLAFACTTPLLLFGLARRRRGLFLLLVGVLAIVAGAATGCGGASKPLSTPPGTYSVPVTITAGSTTQAVNLKVVVQ